MLETSTFPPAAVQGRKGISLGAVFPALFQPRQIFPDIASQAMGIWLVPMLLISVASLAEVGMVGWIKQVAALSGQVQLPPYFEYMLPEQQNQFMQAASATSSPVFLYVFPALATLAKIWFGWLLVSGVIHLVLTILGGRGHTRVTLNVVAWASLPFALRAVVRAVGMLSTRQLIQFPGLSGFAPAGGENMQIYMASLLALVDMYLIWHILLLIIGGRSLSGIANGKVVSGVLVTMSLLTGLQGLVGFALVKVSTLTVIRPFF